MDQDQQSESRFKQNELNQSRVNWSKVSTIDPLRIVHKQNLLPNWQKERGRCSRDHVRLAFKVDCSRSTESLYLPLEEITYLSLSSLSSVFCLTCLVHWSSRVRKYILLWGLMVMDDWRWSSAEVNKRSVCSVLIRCSFTVHYSKNWHVVNWQSSLDIYIHTGPTLYSTKGLQGLTP